MRRFARSTAIGLLFVGLVGCSIVTPTPTRIVPPAGQNSGPADQALEQFVPVDALGRVPGGAACKADNLGGGGGNGSSSRTWIFTCPRVGIDRTVYFTVVDALDAELHRIATVPHSGSDSGDTTSDTRPPWNDWDVRGETYIGFVRTIGIPGPGNLTIVVSLDLITP